MPALPARRGRHLALPVTASALVMAVGLALLPLAFVAIDHRHVVAWTNALFDLAGL